MSSVSLEAGGVAVTTAGITCRDNKQKEHRGLVKM